MAAALVGGAALGAPFGLALQELYSVITDAVQKARMFNSLLKSLESKLESLIEWFERIKELTEKLGMKEKEIISFNKQKEQRKELIRKCLEISKWNLYKKIKYTSKLSKLDEELKEFVQFFLQLLNTVAILKTAVAVNESLNDRNGGPSCTVPQPPSFLVGWDVPVKELKRQLLYEKVSVLVLSAPGGCGKTTLVKKLCQDEEIKGTYQENIFFVEVSKTPNVRDIVSNLFRHKGHRAPNFQDDDDAANQLRVLFEEIKSSILLILDNVQSESIIKKFVFNILDYQILVTSRTTFEGNIYKNYTLPILNNEDAKTLLHYSAGLKERSSPIPNEDMKKILKGCGGFPLALEVIGGSLHGRPPEAWQSWVNRWSSGDSIIDPTKTVLGCLKRSFVDLGDVVGLQECFLDLGLFPEGQRIPVTALIDMWAELYKLDADGLDAITKLHEITSRNMARLVLMREAGKDVGKYYNEDFVLQHNLLRQLAIDQSSEEPIKPIKQRKRLIVNISSNNILDWCTKHKLIGCWTKQKLLRINARILSISTDGEFRSNWCNIQPSKVEVLVLNFQAKNYTLPKFIKKIHKLKVLIVTNYGFSCAELSNFQFLKSAPCLKKIRLEKVSIPSLYNASIRLRSLEKISLFMCNIGQAFKNWTTKISDAMPNLMEINIDYCNDLEELPDSICEHTRLKKLSITNCHKLSKLPQELGELRNLEMLRLRSCTDLLELPESIRNLHKLSILDISDCLYITKLPEHIGELCKLENLHLEGCLRLRSALPPSTLDLERLKLVTCDEVMARSWESMKEFLGNLQVKVAARDVNLNWLCNHDL